LTEQTNFIDPKIFGCSVGFVKAPFADCVKAVVEVRREITGNVNQIRHPSERLDLAPPVFFGPTSADEKAQHLLPFTTDGFTCMLLSEARNGWCCLWANNYGGIANTPDAEMAARRNRWPYLSVVLENRKDRFSLQFVYVDFSISENAYRVIYLHRESRLEFKAIGTPLPFEDLSRYEARQKRDRFSVEVIAEYCGHLGIDLLDKEFYGGQFAKVTPPKFTWK
jgi:hypothetical protein